MLDAALALFDEAGYAAVTIEDIRRRSEVSASSIYHRFGDKAGIAGALYVQALADFQVGLAQALEKSPQARPGIRAAIVHHLGWIDANRPRARFLMRQREARVVQKNQAGIDLMNRETFAAIDEWYRPLVAGGELRELEMPLLYALWFGPAQEYARVGLDVKGQTELAEAAPVFADAAWSALRSSR